MTMQTLNRGVAITQTCIFKIKFCLWRIKMPQPVRFAAPQPELPPCFCGTTERHRHYHNSTCVNRIEFTFCLVSPRSWVQTWQKPLGFFVCARILWALLYRRGAKIVVPCKIPMELLHVKEPLHYVLRTSHIMQGKIKVSPRSWHMTLVAVSLRCANQIDISIHTFKLIFCNAQVRWPSGMRSAPGYRFKLGRNW